MEIDIPCPSLDEQNRISAALSDIDTLIANLEKLIAKKKAIKQGAMQELLTGKRKLPGFTEEWKINKIGAFGEFVSGSCFPLAYQGKQGERYPFYKVSDFNNPGNERNLNQANNYISPDTADERHEMDVHIEEVCATIPNKLDSALFAMFYKARFLNLIHNFLIFDKGQKKVCWYNQYYGIMRAQKRLTSGKGGIIWHTQGSGKSLTMIWLSKWLLSNIPTARVLIVTDRDELDEQIERNYKGVNETIIRTKSGADLLARLNSHEDRLLCSLVHKFGKRGGEATAKDYERYIEELKASLPANFSAKDDIFVFVDECHRTQSGKLHLAMKTIMPNAIFVGFTGTPLLKSDKAS